MLESDFIHGLINMCSSFLISFIGLTAEVTKYGCVHPSQVPWAYFSPFYYCSMLKFSSFTFVHLFTIRISRILHSSKIMPCFVFLARETSINKFFVLLGTVFPMLIYFILSCAFGRIAIIWRDLQWWETRKNYTLYKARHFTGIQNQKQ